MHISLLCIRATLQYCEGACQPEVGALDCRTELHFVRCIKPNNEQAQEDYDAALVLHQLRCCGITEVARIARAGYPTRYAHQQFAQRYSSLLGNRAPRKPLCPPCNR